MKILYSFLDFSQIAGSQMYFYELSKQMVKRGHECTIISNIGGEITKRAVENGVEVLPFSELGRLNERNYDVINASHTPIIKSFIENNILPSVPIIQTCHSEIIPIEEALNEDRIVNYIAIRESIYKEICISGIKSSLVHLIFNPIDNKIFNEEKTKDDGFILFVGSVDRLRKEPLLDIIKWNEDKKIIVIGRNDYPESFEKYNNVKFMKPQFGVEKYFKKCSYAVGIQKGRTWYEAAFCGKDYCDYEVTSEGQIKKFEKLEKPFLKIREAEFVASQIEKIYEESIK